MVDKKNGITIEMLTTGVGIVYTQPELGRSYSPILTPYREGSSTGGSGKYAPGIHSSECRWAYNVAGENSVTEHA